MIALALLLITVPEPAKANVVEVKGDVVVSISFSARPLEAGTGDVEITQQGNTLNVKARRAANATLAFGAPKLEQLLVRDGARVTIEGFAGKALHIVASGGAVVVVSGKGTTRLVIEGAGTSRIDADGLAADDADITLKDAARAHVNVRKALTCDLKRASRLVVTGKPPAIDKKVAGVAKLELK